MITVKVPATSANMGSGFDSIGIALQYYNTTRISETDSGLSIKIADETSRFLPRDERNLIYRAMRMVFEEVDYHAKGIEILQENRIPVTRGLGSSSASIVSGLLAANKISGEHLDKDALITLAARLEGHPDNTTPALAGGMTIAVEEDHKIIYTKIPVNGNHITAAVFIPAFILRTKTSRGILPSTIPHRDGVYNTGRAALLAAAMMSGKYEYLKVALQDRLHQPYRKGLIRGVDSIFKKAEEHGCLGSYISGAGPTVVSLIQTACQTAFRKNMEVYLRKFMPDWNVLLLKPDNLGARVFTERS